MNLFSNYFDNQDFSGYDFSSLINLGDQNQYEGNYQEATKNYLQVLEFLYQIKDNTQESKDKNNLNSLRASVLSRLGDNLFYLGQYKIATEFYNQQASVLTEIGNSLNLATAHHKVGFCNYFMGLYEFSITSQEQSLAILSTQEEQLVVKQLRCRIHLCIGLNQYALGNQELAVDNYEEGIAIARLYGLQHQEAEISAYLSTPVRENLNLRNEKVDVASLNNLIGDLQYAIRVAHKNPYIKALVSKELAKVHETIDIDISQIFFEDALNLSKTHNLPFLSELQNSLNLVLQKKQELTAQYYVLEDQPWYNEKFPQISEVERHQLESSGFKADFVIVTATSIELEAVICLLKRDNSNNLLPCRMYTSSGNQYYLGKFGNHRTVVTQSRMGDRNEFGSNTTTRQALHEWNPKAVIMVGIAFGKKPTKQNIADVLVATKLIDYESIRMNSDGSIDDRGDHLQSNGQLLRLFEQAYGWEFRRPDGSLSKSDPGPILSGNKLIDNFGFKTELFERFSSAKGGEMEGIGFATAANEMKKPWILIKAICDWADGNKNDHYQPLAAAAAASLVHYVLLQKTILSCFE
jgi:nucleoside phosphorylase